MTQWKSDQLDKVARAEELQIASVRRDGSLRKPVTTWVVRHGDDLYVRSVRDALRIGSVVPKRGTRVRFGPAEFNKTSHSSRITTSTMKSMPLTGPSTADT
jgi:Uncharacterized protein conserved in bacteria (DUF2255)